MPYIDPTQRVKFTRQNPRSVGELNYAITKLCLTFLGKGTTRYCEYNDIIGVLECAKLEFYRRAVAAYENEAIERNGDIY
ncbi:MAG: hypothetical protein V3R87_09315 [Dehalococcoidia bacterium]